ncbi:hypothetical protein [Nitrosomonas sp.]|uniref:hypothetical protein n=1 Tax=Nitrosomonas sp. TaxID=42353 RepID=UPI00260E20A7|nr:hypothetical protein [Nitrosomonas sp.]
MAISIIDLFKLDGQNGFTLNGTAKYDEAGHSVSSAGDVNGDGFGDVIVGNYNDGGSGNTSYVVFGKASGFSAAMNLPSRNGNVGFRLTGNYEDIQVSGAGDINGDGFDDVIIGAHLTNVNGSRSGSSFVVFGKGSGFSATSSLTDLNGSNGFRMDGVSAFDNFGRSVSTAGDINGDGFDDLIVSASGADPNGDTSGSSYVVFGKNSGFSATLNPADLDGSNGFRLDGTIHGSGNSVSDAGDVNGDGFDDLIIGADGGAQNGISSGSSYVVFGGNDFDNVEVITGTPGNDKLVGKSAAEIFQAGAGNDNMLGRGGADQFFGDAGNDYIRVSDLDFKFVDGGIGKDTLALGGSGWNFNLANLTSKIDSIETISLFGTGDNTLTLTAGDVINISDGGNTLKVNGNAGDRIIGLSSGWEDGGIHGNFHTYTAFGGDAILLVGINVTTDFA